MLAVTTILGTALVTSPLRPANYGQQRAPAIVTMGARRSRYNDDGTRERSAEEIER